MVDSQWKYLSFIIPIDECLSISRYIKLLSHSLTHRNTFANLVILFISVVGLVSSLIRYELIETLKADQHTHILYYIVWICVLISSVNCCKIYIDIFIDFYQTRQNYKMAWKLTVREFNTYFPFGCLIVSSLIGVAAVVDLYIDMSLWRDKIQQYRLPAVNFYYILLVSRLIQRSLACLLIALVIPVTKNWLTLSSRTFKEHIIHLLPWQLFHTTQRVLVILSIFDNFNGISYRFVVFLIYQFWIVLLAMKVADSYIFPVIYVPNNETYARSIYDDDTNSSSNDQQVVVSGLTSTTVNYDDYPTNAELVRGRVTERFQQFLQPNSSSDAVRTSVPPASRYSNYEVSYSEVLHEGGGHHVRRDGRLSEVIEGSDVLEDPLVSAQEGIRQRTRGENQTDTNI